MAKRSLAEFVPREKLDGLIAWLGNFPKVEPDVEITELDGVMLDPELLQPAVGARSACEGWRDSVRVVRIPGETLYGSWSVFVLGKTDLQGRECWELCDTTQCKGEPWYHLWYIAVEDAVLRISAITTPATTFCRRSLTAMGGRLERLAIPADCRSWTGWGPMTSLDPQGLLRPWWGHTR